MHGSAPAGYAVQMPSIDKPDERLALALRDVSGRGWPVFSLDHDVEAAQAKMSAAGLGDGLPLVMPTAERIGRMLAGIPAVIGNPAFGHVPPMEGALTQAAAAYNAVIAGCRPAELQLLLTAAAATLAPSFNLLGLQTTTGTATVALLVHGPAVQALGMNAEHNCLGPGNRANACIGRALHFLLNHIGGAIPGATDMATMGQPGKYVFCFAEGTHPALPPLHARRGLAASDSAVTVLGFSGTFEVLALPDATGPQCMVPPLASTVRAAAYAGGVRRYPQPNEHVVLVPPELLNRMQDAGCDWRTFHAQLAEACGDALVPDASALVLVCTGGIGEKMSCLQPWGGGSLSVTRRIDPGVMLRFR
jgi:hypothetical protein